jgi:hypothetical protein
MQLGQTGNLAADANEDNIVNSKDYDLWRSNFGRTETTGIGTVANVPESTTRVLVLVAGCAFILRRKNLRQIQLISSRGRSKHGLNNDE